MPACRSIASREHSAGPPYALHYFDCIASDLGLVVLDIASLKQDHFAADPGLDLSRAHRPLFERRTGKIRQQLIAMDAQNLFQKDPVQPNAIGKVRDAETGASQEARKVGIAEHAVAEAKSITLRSLCLVAMDEPREIQFEFMIVTLCVRALDLAQLALKAGVHDRARLGGGDAANIAIVLLVQQRKKRWEAVAVLEAEPAAVADLERPPDLLV